MPLWNETPFVLTMDNQHPLAPRVKLLDRDGNYISRVVSFNMFTFEATQHNGEKVEVAAAVLDPPIGHPAYEVSRENLFSKLTDPNHVETRKIP